MFSAASNNNNTLNCGLSNTGLFHRTRWLVIGRQMMELQFNNVFKDQSLSTFFLPFLVVCLLTRCLSFYSPSVATAAPGITSESSLSYRWPIVSFPRQTTPSPGDFPSFLTIRSRSLYHP